MGLISVGNLQPQMGLACVEPCKSTEKFFAFLVKYLNRPNYSHITLVHSAFPLLRGLFSTLAHVVEAEEDENQKKMALEVTS